LDGPSVTELLLRRSPLALCLGAFFDLEDACLLHADSTETVTLCWTWLVRGSGARSNSAVSDRGWDERVEHSGFDKDKPSTCVFDPIDRRWCTLAQAFCEYVPIWNRGRGPFCVNGCRSTSERRRKAPTVKPTFLLIIVTETASSTSAGGASSSGRGWEGQKWEASTT
jgi:hypothetical protein